MVTTRTRRTPRDRLVTIADYRAFYGYAPTIRDLKRIWGLASESPVHHHLKNLRELGYVNWVDGQTRTLTITKEGMKCLEGGTE